MVKRKSVSLLFCNTTYFKLVVVFGLRFRVVVKQHLGTGQSIWAKKKDIN